MDFHVVTHTKVGLSNSDPYSCGHNMSNTSSGISHFEPVGRSAEMLNGHVDHACRLEWKTVKLPSFWCSFYSLKNDLVFSLFIVLMTIKTASPSPHPCSLPGNKSDFSSSRHCRKEISSKSRPWYCFAVWTCSCLIEPVHLVKNKFLVWEGDTAHLKPDPQRA